MTLISGHSGRLGLETARLDMFGSYMTDTRGKSGEPV